MCSNVLTSGGQASYVAIVSIVKEISKQNKTNNCTIWNKAGEYVGICGVAFKEKLSTKRDCLCLVWYVDTIQKVVSKNKWTGQLFWHMIRLKHQWVSSVAQQ